ncbi:MAG: multicopper oxidase family protein [Pseudomonadota bacterium]
MTRKLTRRSTLKMLGASAALGMGAGGLLLPASLARSGEEGGHTPESGNPLQLMPVDEGKLRDGVRHFSLQIQQGRTAFHPGKPTDTLGINGDYLGPTLRMRRGDQVRIDVGNRMGQPTTLHWHGLHVPQEADGGPHSVIEDGAQWQAAFDVRQAAGTFWYHSHMLHQTGEQVYRGLAGMLLVDDEESAALDLPSEHGVDDIPLVVQDRLFDGDGNLRYMDNFESMMIGMFGDTMVVNGTVDPVFEARRQRLRFRILNASNARQLKLAFSDGRPFRVIAGDGGLLSAPVELTDMLLTPAERVEIVVDVSDGQPVRLMNLASPMDFPEFRGALSQMMRSMNTETMTILSIVPASTLESSPGLPSSLVEVPPLPPARAVQHRNMWLNMGYGPRSGGNRGPGLGNRNGFGGGHGGGHFGISGRAMDLDYINERVPLGNTEIWTIENRTPMMHPFHIHGGLFRVLDRNGRPPPAHEAGYKDTVRIDARQTVSVIMSFTDYAHETIPFMFHCHTLEHEDRGMMGQFLVLDA